MVMGLSDEVAVTGKSVIDGVTARRRVTRFDE
jgi:hypothetical protein